MAEEKIHFHLERDSTTTGLLMLIHKTDQIVQGKKLAKL